MSVNNMRIAMLGCGNMGEAILSRLLGQGIFAKDQVNVAEKAPERQSYLAETYGVQVTDVGQAIEGADLVIVAVKPQQFNDLPDMSLASGAVVISIMAGKSIGELRQRFKEANIVRVMPNLGFKTGNGVSGFYLDPDSKWQPEQTELIKQVLGAGGLTFEMPNEPQLDVLTAISGSGPAYFYWFAELLAGAAADAGFGPEEAQAIVRQTFIGAAELLKASPELQLNDLQSLITSKGGTSEAALEVLSKSDGKQTVLNAVQAARARAVQLAEPTASNNEV